MTEIQIQRFDDNQTKYWDSFVLDRSYNGTFLQTRNFLNYHPSGRFEDASVILYKGSAIVAVVPACVKYMNGKKTFYSHPGSTFGGILIGKDFYNLRHVEAVLDGLERFWRGEGYEQVIIKQPSQIFSLKNNDLLEYFLFQKGYEQSSEISFVIDFQAYQDNIISNFSAKRRRDYRYGERNGMLFRDLEDESEYRVFYDMLTQNLQKFDARPVHTYEELLDLKKNRLQKVARLYGTFWEGRMVAGAMVFEFGTRVFHTQYLASSQNDLALYPNEVQDANLIQVAKNRGFRFFSFGTSTFENGRKLNASLASFKEGFGTGYSNNHTFHRLL